MFKKFTSSIMERSTQVNGGFGLVDNLAMTYDGNKNTPGSVPVCTWKSTIGKWINNSVPTGAMSATSQKIESG